MPYEEFEAKLNAALGASKAGRAAMSPLRAGGPTH